jgi:hypothetical protein
MTGFIAWAAGFIVWAAIVLVPVLGLRALLKLNSRQKDERLGADRPRMTFARAAAEVWTKGIETGEANAEKKRNRGSRPFFFIWWS